MPAFADCVAAVRKAAGDLLSEAEAMDVLERVADHKERLRAEGKVLKLDRELMKAAKAEADALTRAALEQKRRAALAALKHQELSAHLDHLKKGGLSPVEALLAVMPPTPDRPLAGRGPRDGAERAVMGVRASVWRMRQSYQDRYIGGIMGAIAKEKPHLEAKLGDQEFNDRVELEMEQIGRKPTPRDGSRGDPGAKGGRPGLTGDADAKWLAELFARYGELSRRDRNRLGADIPVLRGPHAACRVGWAARAGGRPPRAAWLLGASGGNGHDPYRIMKAGEKEWIAFVRPLLVDGDRPPQTDLRSAGDPGGEGAEEALAETWRTLVTGRDRDLTPAQEGLVTGSSPGPPSGLPLGVGANLAKSLHKARELHFKPGAWKTYNERFGPGSPRDRGSRGVGATAPSPPPCSATSSRRPTTPASWRSSAPTRARC